VTARRHPPFLIITRHALQFNPASDYTLDATAFTGLLDTCQAHPHPRLAACDACLERLAGALALYQGDFLAGFSAGDGLAFEEWALLQRERLGRLVMETLGHLIDCYEGRGEYEEALQHARRQVALDPWREDAQRQLMRPLALSGQRVAALDQYEACRRLLAAEMDIEPAGETRRLAEQIRAGKLGEGTRLQRVREEFFSALTYHLHPPAPAPPFVARDAELRRLNEFLQATLSGQGRVAFVTGDAGQGKTAILQEFARRAQVAHPDLIVAGGSGNAHIGSGDPYQPFREVLGLLTGGIDASYASETISQDCACRLWGLLPLAIHVLLEDGPDLIGTLLPAAALLRRAVAFGPTDRDWLPGLEKLVKRQPTYVIQASLHQPDLFDQVTRVLVTLARQKPLLLLLDDLQWADSTSLNLLLHLGRRIAGQRILLLGAYRPVEVSLGRDGERHPLKLVVNKLKRRFGDLEVDLSQAEDSQFADAYLDTEPNQLGEAFRQVLCRQTRGQPLFTVELLRDMQARGDLVRDTRGHWVEGSSLDWDTLPERVEAVIAERTDRLPERLYEALAIASVEGDTFTAEVLARVQGVSEHEMVRWLSDKLERVHRLVSAQGVQQKGHGRVCLYRFRHILFQKYLYQQLSQAERAYLHQAIGIALEELYEEQASAIAVRLARHFQEAGMAEKAIDYLRQAGERAARLSAHQEAVAHFRRGLRWLETLPQGSERARLKLSLCVGLATSLQAITGYGDPEVGRLYTRARLLCDQGFDTVGLQEAKALLDELAEFEQHLASKTHPSLSLPGQILTQRSRSTNFLPAFHHCSSPLSRSRVTMNSTGYIP
jgi:DNA-binding SARP family transcriptional activator